MTRPTPSEPFPPPLPPSGPGILASDDPTLTAAERDILAAVHAWARTHGWTPHEWLGWINASTSDEATAAVRIERVGGCGLSIFSRPTKRDPWPMRATFHTVPSVGRGVDILVEQGVLPHFPPVGPPGSARYWPTAAAYTALGA